jgi:hypothetical protein
VKTLLTILTEAVALPFWLLAKHKDPAYRYMMKEELLRIEIKGIAETGRSPHWRTNISQQIKAHRLLDGELVRRKISLTNDFAQAGERYHSLSKMGQEHMI